MAATTARAPTMVFADRVGLLGTEQAFALAALIREAEESGRDVIRCNLGQPDFPLPRHIGRAVQEAIDEGLTTYCDAQGLLELRQTVARDVAARRGLDEIDPDRVVIFPGARAPIGFAQQTYCQRGDEVVYPTPGYPLFESFIRYVGATPKPIRLREDAGFAFSGDDLAEVVTERTRLVYLNFPSNPTGGVATPEQLRSVAEVLLPLAAAGARVYSDESYEAILFDGRKHHSIASLPGMDACTIIVSGVSKTYSWTGGRVGWAVYPTVEEALVHRNLNINYFASIPPYNQIGAKVALESPESAPAVGGMVAAFQERRDVTVALLNELEGVRCLMPQGAFYVFPNVGGLLERVGAIDAYRELEAGIRERTSPATLFQLFLLFEYGVATMDRRSFGTLESEGQHFLRVSIATGREELERAVELMDRAGRDADGFRAFIREGRHLWL
jgi:aspartate aminotransferase